MAIECLQREIIVDTSNLDYLTHLGDNYIRIESVNLAIKVFSKILIINPNDQLTAIKLSNLFIKNKEYTKAIEVCDMGLFVDSTNRKLIKIKGIASFNIPDFKTAENCFGYLYELGDSSKFVLKHMGISEFNNNLLFLARDHLLQAFKLDSTDYEVCFMLGRCFQNPPEPEKGLYFLNRMDSLLQPDPKILSALYNEKQSIYSSAENYQKALKCYIMAYKYNPKPEYVFYMASLYQNRLNDKKRAIEEYERFLRILPKKNDNEGKTEKSNRVISLKSIATRNIIKLKEELFFEGENQ
jgi:tetratricopeptide (TPR) repeat protein